MNEPTIGIAAVDAYIAGYPEKVQGILQEMRALILRAMPDAAQKIGYGIPTFTLNGKNIVHIGGFANHVSLFPGGEGVEHFLPELDAYKTSRGTIQFALDQPIPYELIQRIVEFCVQKHRSEISRKAAQ